MNNFLEKHRCPKLSQQELQNLNQWTTIKNLNCRSNYLPLKVLSSNLQGKIILQNKVKTYAFQIIPDTCKIFLVQYKG